MSSLHKNADTRLFSLGIRVRRAAAQLPQTATASIFTVTGGRIRVQQLIGEYTVAAGLGANTLIVSYLASQAGAAALAWSIASAAQASAIKGVHLWLPAAAASALSSDVAAPVGAGGVIPILNQVCPPGAVRLQATGNNPEARVMWDLYYVPIDTGAKVVAA